MNKLLKVLVLVLVVGTAVAAIAPPAFAEDRGIYAIFTGTGINDNDVLFTSTELSRFDACLLTSTAGAVDVFATLDGTTYSTAAVSLQDFGATTNDPVLVTAAGRIYGLAGNFNKLRVLQNGATAATAILRCWKM